MKNFIKAVCVVVLSVLRVWFLLFGGVVLGVGRFLAWFGGEVVGFATKYSGYITKLLQNGK